MRVLLCTDYLPPSDGGVEQVVEQLAERLAARGDDVIVFTLADREETFTLSNHADIEVCTARKIDLTGYIGLQSAVSPMALRAFRRLLQRYEPDVVHVHNRFFFTSYVGLLYEALSGYPLVTTLHLGSLKHIDGVGGAAARMFQRVFAARLVQTSDAVICVSDAVRVVADALGAEETHVIHNAVDLKKFRAPTPSFDKTLLSVGRLVRNNGVQDLVEALPHILLVHPDASVNIVGTGDLESAIRRRLSELGIEDSVTMHGFVDDITRMYEIADVFCRPSYSEGLPLTLLESMATSTVPVVTPVAGTSEVITDESTGYFVDVADSSSIAERITWLFDHPEELERTADRARSHVEREFSWTHRAEEVRAVYERVTSHE